MDYLMGGLSSIVSIVSFVIFAAGVMKAFQIATTLSEIKDILTAIKLNGPIQSAVGGPLGSSAPLPLTQSGEEMLRALSMELDHPVPPAVVDVKHDR